VRSLVKLIERSKRKIVYTSFNDELGREMVVPLLDVPVGVDVEKAAAKAQEFLKKHEQEYGNSAIEMERTVDFGDLLALEQIFAGRRHQRRGHRRGKTGQSWSRPFCALSLVGLDRAAGESGPSPRSWRARRSRPIRLSLSIWSSITSRGAAGIDPVQLYESPFIDLHPHGV